MLQDAAITGIQIEHEVRHHPIATAADWWTIVRGSGYRGTLDQLSAKEIETVRQLNFEGIERVECREIATDALLAIAKKPEHQPSIRVSY